MKYDKNPGVKGTENGRAYLGPGGDCPHPSPCQASAQAHTHARSTRPRSTRACNVSERSHGRPGCARVSSAGCADPCRVDRIQLISTRSRHYAEVQLIPQRLALQCLCQSSPVMVGPVPVAALRHLWIQGLAVSAWSGQGRAWTHPATVLCRAIRRP